MHRAMMPRATDFRQFCFGFFGIHSWLSQSFLTSAAYELELNNASTLLRTFSSIRISGGQSRWNRDSPGSFFVASMPSLLQLAISLVARSSTSDGPLLEILCVAVAKHLTPVQSEACGRAQVQRLFES